MLDASKYEFIHLKPVHFLQRVHENKKSFGNKTVDDIFKECREYIENGYGAFIEDKRQYKESDWVFIFKTEANSGIAIPLIKSKKEVNVMQMKTLFDVYKSKGWYWYVHNYNKIIRTKQISGKTFEQLQLPYKMG